MQVFKLVTEGTLEEKIAAMIEKKRQMMDERRPGRRSEAGEDLHPRRAAGDAAAERLKETEWPERSGTG